jgi:hypothetical protein
MKKLTAATLILALALCLTACGGDTAANVDAPAVGDIIQFGGYDWQVLEVKGSTALLLSKDILELRLYNDEDEDVTWEICDLRKYLNGNFYNSFSEDDRVQIMEAKIENKDNQWYDTKGGETTNDYIFLLSLEEVVKYFGDSGGVRPALWLDLKS